MSTPEYDREYNRRRRQRLRAAGSCQDCGAEAVNGTTRCTPCGQRNAANARRRVRDRLVLSLPLFRERVRFGRDRATVQLRIPGTPYLVVRFDGKHSGNANGSYRGTSVIVDAADVETLNGGHDGP